MAPALLCVTRSIATPLEGNGRKYWWRRLTLHFCTDFPLWKKTRKEGGPRNTVPAATLLSFLSVRVIHAVSSTAETALGVERALPLVLGHSFHSLVHVRRPVLDRPWEGKRGKRGLDGLPHFSYALQVVGCPRHQARLILARPKRT